MNKSMAFGLISVLLLTAAAAMADDAMDLVALDKVWGEATGPADLEGLLASDIVSTDGVSSPTRRWGSPSSPTC